MTKTIGWILLAIFNAVMTLVLALDIVDRIKSDMGFIGSAIFCGFFFIMTLVWVSCAKTEYKEYQNWINDEQ